MAETSDTKKEIGPIARRAVALRAELREREKETNWTQELVAKRGGLRREEVNKIEKGGNLGTSDRIRRSLAIGYGVAYEDMSSYLAGTMTLSELLSRRMMGPPTADKFSIPKLLWDTFRTGKKGRNRHPWGPEALDIVARDYQEEPAEGWAWALTRAEKSVRKQRDAERERRVVKPKLSEAAPKRKRATA